LASWAQRYSAFESAAALYTMFTKVPATISNIFYTIFLPKFLKLF
jgi:hypothetical protein